jgi:hypothetical protein
VSSTPTLRVRGPGARKDKLAKAEQFGVEQMTAEEFAELVASAE